MTYEEKEEQEKLLPSCLHHDRPGAEARREAALFLAVIGGEVLP